MYDDIQIVVGEDRSQPQSMVKTYVQYESPTGARLPIGRCSILKRQFYTVDGSSLNRVINSTYKVTQKCILWFHTFKTVLGKRAVSYSIKLNIDPKGKAIKFTGIDGCGMFQGRVDMEQEGLLSGTVIAEELQYRVLAPPIIEREDIGKSSFKRKLII